MHIRFLVPLAAVALAVTACSTSTNEVESDTSGSPAACSYDQTVDGVTAIQQGGGTPELTIADDAVPPTELVANDLCTGIGEAATTTDTVTVDYLGVGYKSRQEFDSSYARGVPSTFLLSQVIPGWTEGVAGMKPGGARLLLVPAEMAYGANGYPPDIKPNEALAFIVELDAIS